MCNYERKQKMDKKPFLRGFGTGVLFAAAILGISFTIRTSEPATIARAKKLGMVFENNNQAAHGYVREHQSEYNTR